jgi:hypothetical protein
MLASSVAWDRRRWAGAWWFAWPAAWIIVGVVLLASTTGRLGLEPGELIARWWPVLPIAAGLWFLLAAIWPGRSRPLETLRLPLGGIESGRIRIRFGAGSLRLGRSEAGTLVSGTFTGGVNVITHGPGAIELEPDLDFGPWAWDRPFDWRLGVTGEVPLELRVETGAARATLDLEDLRVDRLDLRTGASETEVTLPRAAGATSVRVEAGAASVTINVPSGVAARIRSRMALGTTQVDQVRFPRTADGFASPDYERAEHRVDLELQGGVGTITVR